jgi:transcription initiation factor TFIIIB Brf1 subunit/transcription initiation factor TFIIB
MSAIQASTTSLAECAHPYTTRSNGQTHCRDCGEAILSFCKEDTSYFDDASVVLITDRKAPKSIRKELDLLALPDEIKDRADRIYAYKVGDNTYRANVRQEVKFCCIFEAYKEAGIIRDPNEIAQMLGIKRKGMSRGIMRCSSLFTGKANTSEQVPLTALDLVPEMLNRCGVQADESHLDDMARIYTYAKDRSELLNRSKPQSIAAALIFYYLSNMVLDRKIPKNEIAKNCGISVMTLNKLSSDFTTTCAEAE